MQITRENIGDTLCLYASAKCIRILDVSPQYVDYATEDGYHYATKEHSVDAIPVTNSERLAVFDENYKLGRTLNAAEYKAFVGLFDGTKKENSAVNNVLSTIKEQQRFLDSRLHSDRGRTAPGEALANEFLSQLSERSSGSHDTFWGHKIKLISNWSYEFEINGKVMDYATAKDYLSQVRFSEPTKKLSLDDKIREAGNRREKVPSSGPEHDLIGFER